MEAWEWGPFFARRWVSILVVTVLTVAVVMGATFFIAPTYEATSTLQVQPMTNSDPLGYPTNSEMNAQNYGELVKSPIIEQRAAKLLGQAELSGKAEFRVLENSSLLLIAVRDKSPGGAADQANAMAEALIATNASSMAENAARVRKQLDAQLASLRKQITATQGDLDAARRTAGGQAKVTELQDQLDSLQTAYQNVQRESQLLPANQTIVSSALLFAQRAVAPSDPISPKPILNLMLAIVAGALLGVAYARFTEPRSRKTQ